MSALDDQTLLQTSIRFTTAATTATVVAGVTGFHIVVDYLALTGNAGTGSFQFIDGLTTGLMGPQIFIPAADTVVFPDCVGLRVATKSNTLAVTTLRATGDTLHGLYLRYRLIPG